jgi:16S rRNA (guanine527-N7)-methyltransferase
VTTLKGRGIRKHDVALVSGAKVIDDILRLIPERCEAWISAPKHAPPPPRLPERAAWYELSARLFRKLDVFGTASPLLLVKAPGIETWSPRDGFIPGCNLLVPFQDPENVGAVIRSAVAFGVKSIVLLSESAHPYHPKAVRASGGAVFLVPLHRGPSVDALPADLPIIALSPEGRSVSDFEFPASFGLLPGVEGPGVPNHFRAHALSVPMRGDVESLNAASATAIVLYLWSQSAARKRG